MVRYGMVFLPLCSGIVLYAWYSLVGRVWHGEVWYVIKRYGRIWCGIVLYGWPGNGVVW